MSEADSATAKEYQASAEFVELEQQLAQETSVLALMKEQMTSMLGMVAMFVVTIVLALFIRPWYDVAELHAFGETGATQARFILLELIMIFIFTAVVIALARYKKEWVIKYGIMGVLTIALMYTTVPLMHMLVIDFDRQEFDYEESMNYSGDYFVDLGMDGFLSSEVVFDGTSWVDAVSYMGIGNNVTWLHESSRAPLDDTAKLRVVKSDNWLTFANSRWLWSVDIDTGAELERYYCDDSDEAVDYAKIPPNCDLGLILEDGIYTITRGGDVKYIPTKDLSSPYVTQAEWGLPPYVDIGDEFIESQTLDDMLLITTERVSIAFKLEQTRDSPTEIGLVDVRFQYLTDKTISSIDFGHSPWSESNLSTNTGDNGLLIIGETNGNVTGWEWDGKKTGDNEFVLQDKMNIEGLVDSVYQVQITDLDDSGFTDLLISGDRKAHWLHTQLLKNRLTFDVDEDFKFGIFTNDGSVDKFFAVSEASIESGVIDDDMYTLEGLQLYDIPFLVGVIIALLLMILLYFHSEWYVVNTVGILVGAGVIVMLGVAFVPGLIMIFMILAAIYDAWAVYRSKHMLELADTMIGLQLPILLVAPQDRGYSFKDEKTKMVEKTDIKPIPQVEKTIHPVKKKTNEALFMGLGDIIFPGMLVLSAVQWLETDNSFEIAIFTLAGSLVGYLALMSYVARGKAQAGLPLLNGGAILGYLLGGMIFIGTEIFNLGISL